VATEPTDPTEQSEQSAPREPTEQSAPTGQSGPSPRLAAPSYGRLFFDRVKAMPDQEAFRYPAGTGWASLTWEQTGERVANIAAGLLALGIEAEDRVSIACSTRIEWVLADLGVMCAGAATTTVYPSTQTDDVVFIVANSGSRVVIAEDAEQVAKLRGGRDRLPAVQRVVVIDGLPEPEDGDWVSTLADLEASGQAALAERPELVEDSVARIRADHLATLIYTSGTTGRPKGVELTHGNWMYEAASVEALGILHADDLQYLWLPLAHSFGKVLLVSQAQIGFATAIDGRVDAIVQNLPVVKPTFMAGVPRVFEKVYGAATSGVREHGGIKERIFDQAFAVGSRVSTLRLDGRPLPALLRARNAVADRLVFSTLKARLGGRIRFFVSGSAPLSPKIAEWFSAAGLDILEGYGLTETSAGSTINRPETLAFGTVGPPLPGTEIRIADDGEIMIRGGGVMRGYHGDPEQTAAVLDAEGWFATGDVGELDAAGRLRITDRKKDLLKTSAGKYVAPQAIEVEFKAVCPLAAQMIVVARNYVAALIGLDGDALRTWAAARGLPGDFAVLSQHEQTRQYLQSCVDDLNGRLNRWETVKRFTVLDRELSIDDGELTPSMKVRRGVVETRYEDAIDELFAADGPRVAGGATGGSA
jgi:long-chain acyl-CoA synthetase